MSTAEESPPRLSATDPVRLLPRPSATTLGEHLARFGPRPEGNRRLIDQVEAAGLRGRGGAGFPTATKLAAVAARPKSPVVVANGTEGEPASAKDKVLLQAAPHLVLDGIELAAELLGGGRRLPVRGPQLARHPGFADPGGSGAPDHASPVPFPGRVRTRSICGR